MNLKSPPAGTHDVFNQPPALENYNAYERDPALQEAVRRFAAAGGDRNLDAIGAAAGSAEAIRLGFQANQHGPELLTHDRFGNRIDEVEFHPSWHALMKRATGFGLHAAAWHDPRPGAHAARAAGFYLWNQAEAGHGCPVSMTYAVVPALRNAPQLAAVWEMKFAAGAYDPELRFIDEKSSALCGMGMTEKQGGSDVRANTTRAEYDGQDDWGARYRVTGHKWFCSAPMCDAFLVLAQTAAGLSCFLVPRITPDGARNTFAIQRLKDKLGNRSNASGEVEFADTSAWLVGEEGRGIHTIIEMVNSTRLDCVNGSASLMRQALVQAMHHTRHRRAFGELLADQPLMKNVLCDLAIESEAAMTLMLRLAKAADGAPRDPREAQIKRFGTAIAKYWVCKRTPVTVAEALECLGGNGYVEESMMPRLYREAPLNSIWEGSGNINALDVLRAAAKGTDAYAAYREEIGGVAREPAVASVLAIADAGIRDSNCAPTTARRTVEALALVWQYALLRESAEPEVADAFYRSRLAREGGLAFGTLPQATAFARILERAYPA